MGLRWIAVCCEVDVCCVVDISGSMGTIAKYEGEDGTMRDDGLSLLDVVKHAVKTVPRAHGRAGGRCGRCVWAAQRCQSTETY